MIGSRRLLSGRARLTVLAVIGALAVGLLALPSTAAAATCDDFSTQQDAQNFFDQNRSANTNLDTNNNGVACENLSGSPSPVFARTGFPAWIFIVGALAAAGGAVALRVRPRRT